MNKTVKARVATYKARVGPRFEKKVEAQLSDLRAMKNKAHSEKRRALQAKDKLELRLHTMENHAAERGAFTETILELKSTCAELQAQLNDATAKLEYAASFKI